MDEKLAFNCGVYYSLSGVNEINCNFAIFSKPEYTRAWEKGRDSVVKQLITIGLVSAKKEMEELKNEVD